MSPIAVLPGGLFPVPGLASAGALLAHGLGSALTALARDLVVGLLHGLLLPITTYLLRTPDLLSQRGLREIWLTALGCFAVLCVPLVALSGAVVAAGRAQAGAPLTRLAGCAATAVVALPVVAWEARLADALVAALLPQVADLASTPLVTALAGAAAGSGADRLGLLAVSLVGTLLLALLAVQALLRWAALWLLVGLAPLVAALGLLPGDGGPSCLRLWWRLQLGTVFLPVAHAVLLGSYAAMFAGDTNGLVAALAGVGVLVLLTRLPAWAAGQAVHLGPRDVTGPLRRAALDASRLAPARSGTLRVARARTASAPRDLP
jgi:hypothetical protein